MGRFEILKFVLGPKIDKVLGHGIWPWSFRKLHPAIQTTSKWVQIVPNGFVDTFQPRIDFLMGWMLRCGLFPPSICRNQQRLFTPLSGWIPKEEVPGRARQARVISL